MLGKRRAEATGNRSSDIQWALRLWYGVLLSNRSVRSQPESPVTLGRGRVGSRTAAISVAHLNVETYAIH